MKKIALTSLIMAVMLIAGGLQAETQDTTQNNPREKFRQRDPQNRPQATARATNNADWQQNEQEPNTPKLHKQMPPPPYDAETAGRDRSERFRNSYRDIMRRRNDEFLEWLKESFPLEAEKFDIAAEKSPETSFRDIMPLMMKYREIFETEKKNPELAELMKNDMELLERRNDILATLKNTDDEQRRQSLESEIRDIVAARFDLILEKRKMRFEELQRRLEELSKEIERQKSELSELDNQRDEQIQNRIEQLLSNNSGIQWD